MDLQFTVHPTDVDETHRTNEAPEPLVSRLARAKADAGSEAHSSAVVIGADTVVVVDQVILGKPVDDDDARRMIELLAGRSHHVLTGVSVVVPGGEPAIAVEETVVTFAPMNEADIAWYLGTGDHRDKAGAYGVQGVAGAFITRLDGSFTNVIGLPLSTLRPMLDRAGFSL